MKGCSKKNKRSFLGGGDNLAYPYSGPTIPPPLAYTGKGGAYTASTLIPTNTNADNPALPNTGPPARAQGWIGSQTINGGSMKGGNCMSCQTPLMKGGNCGRNQPMSMKGGCGPLCALGFMAAGKKGKKGKKMIMKGGNPGMPYPDGLVGKSWTPSIGGWPGVDHIAGGRNYLGLNTYDTDISRQMVSPGANPPFLTGGKKHRKTRSHKSRSRKQRGGTLSNFLGQDLINLGRQFQFGLGSTYNALAGYQAPVSPLPWKDQLVRTPNLSSIKSVL
uniref:Uncharacterized protein n=1 Tax=viral metagenome TaxID=1070528 RepID=A0A6C0ARX8_9ZZZZ